MLTSGSGDDTLSGGNDNDTLTSGAGLDVLDGGTGNDILDAGDGADTLKGGLGADDLTGGGENDRFVFGHHLESKVGAEDDIIDFAPGDLIDLSGIDAVAAFDINGLIIKDAVNSAFTFIGAGAFTGAQGQLRYAGGVVQGDINGDAVADFAINVLGAPPLIAPEFVL